jgi:flagellar biosynthesis protein FliQ
MGFATFVFAFVLLALEGVLVSECMVMLFVSNQSINYLPWISYRIRFQGFMYPWMLASMVADERDARSRLAVLHFIDHRIDARVQHRHMSGNEGI